MKRWQVAMMGVVTVVCMMSGIAWGSVTVTNLTARQIPGTKTVELTYDLSSDLTNLVEVVLEVWSNSVPVAGVPVSGDVGTGVSTGANKQIVWDGGAAWDGNLGNLTYRVTGFDDSGFRPPPPAGMVFVRGGTFAMGDTWGDLEPFATVHTVTVSSFYMAKYEVSNEDLREVMQWAYGQGLIGATSATVTNKQGAAQELINLDSSFSQLAFSSGTFSVDLVDKTNCPCQVVSWYGAAAYCNYRSLKEGVTPCYDLTNGWSCDFGASGYRLPTEAEWEYAARGGAAGRNTKYSGSDTINDVAWHYSNSSRQHHPVGTKDANELEVHDMTGNISEWCWDWYGPYTNVPQTDPTGPVSSPSSLRIMRGGSFSASWWHSYVVQRSVYLPEDTWRGGGFRCVRR